MKGYFNILLYISLIFLVIALVRADYLVMPVIHSKAMLCYSLAFLFTGFLFDALSWKKMLNSNNYKVSLNNAYISSGMAIFTKYIPGKIWVILGRSSYIAEAYNYSKIDTSTVSLQAQLLSLWSGVLVALLSLIKVKNDSLNIWLIGLILFWIALSFMIFHNGFLKYSSLILGKVLKKKIILPNVSERKKLCTIPYFTAIWIVWSIGFYFLIRTIHPNVIALNAGFSFALGGTLGIIAVFAPGGLGIREGVLITYLSSLGLTIPESTTIAFGSRIWYLIGECFFFITALIAKKRS